MAFVWPDGVQNKTKRTISQILWTLHLDFDGIIRDEKDAPMALMKAMEAHGVEIKNVMWFRMMLPYLDGGKYGRLITRIVIQRRTKEIRLAVKTLPEDSHLPDGAGGIGTDDRIDMQLFGDTAFTPARGAARDTDKPARGDTRDVAFMPARGDTRDDQKVTEPASGFTGDEVQGEALLAREPARDVAGKLAGGLAPDDIKTATWDSCDEVDLVIRRLDGEVDELLAPLPAEGDDLGPDDLLDVVIGLMANLEGLVRAPAAPVSSNQEDLGTLLAEKHDLLERVGRLMRRVKDAEARLIERNKEIEGAQTQMAVLNERYRRLEANNQALLDGKPVAGHFRAAERFISETPSDRPERGRSKPTRPNGRTTGSDSKLAYSVG